jgi:hypothetical protein
MPRIVVHALLSLLLLATQQMALLHASTHWSRQRTVEVSQADGRQDRAPGANPDTSSAHGVCALCLACAQLADALPAPPHLFLPPALAEDSPIAPRSAGVKPRSTHVFQPRGPPQAA